MTPAIRTIKNAGIEFKIHEYFHNADASSYGAEAAEFLDIEQKRVFRTLLVEKQSGELAVAIVPVSHQLNLKATAKALGVKKEAWQIQLKQKKLQDMF